MSSASSPSQIPPDTPVSDGSVATSVNSSPPTSIDPNSPIFTQPPSPALPPKKDPAFVRGADGVSWYTNTTIDDFSPLVAYSTQPQEWSTHRTPQSRLDSDRFLLTYHLTQQENATATLEFWGSEIRLYGDGGPEYGWYSLTLDGGEPTIHTEHSLAQPVGRDIRMHTLTGLTEGRHELVITVLGSRDGLTAARALLFDYAVVSQRIGEVSGRDSPPKKLDVEADDLKQLETNGTWALDTLPDDIPPLDGGAKPEIYVERKAFWTDENWATLKYSFQGSAIQVFGGWNGTHGAYRATLTSGSGGATNTSTVVHSKIFNATAGCDLVSDEDQEALRCKWRGSTLKYSVASLDPNANHELTLQNLHQGEGHVFEVDLIRVIGTRAGDTPEEPEDGMGYRADSGLWMNFCILFLTLLAARRVLRL